MRTTMRKLVLLTLFTIVSFAANAADNVCPCIPISYTWTVIECESWDCVQSFLVVAKGDPLCFAMPTNDQRYKWVVMKRVVSGTAVISPDAPFLIDSYATFADATFKFVTADPNTLPIIASAIDGSTLVVRLRNPAAPLPAHRRAAGH